MSNLDTRVTALLAKPSLEGLAYALRHPEVWPAEYAKAGWHYSECTRCALGLAFHLWYDGKFIGLDALCKTLDLNRDIAVENIFMSSEIAQRYGSLARVTRLDVADAIDAYLAQQP